MRRRTLLAAGLATGWAAAAGVRPAFARDAFPSQALTLIVPFGPATSVGVNARLLQPHLERTLGQTVALEFDQGAGGLPGHLHGTQVPADGYTMTMISASLTAQPWLTRGGVARPDDYAFIGQVTSFPSVLLVRANSPFRTLADLVGALRDRPESLTTGQLIGWWPPALAQALFFLRAGVKARVVASYYGGSEQVVALSQGQLDFIMVGLADVKPSLSTGLLRGLAVSSHTSVLPATPSFREQGLDVTTAWWRGLAVPKDTSRDIVGRLSAALRQALDDDALRNDFAHSGLSVDPMDGPEFRQMVTDEYKTIGMLLTSLGLNVQTPKPM
jgi:tripartite-type tricarboxylate transporter receptor subunit TctC